MKRFYFRYVNPWTGEIKLYPYVPRGLPQRKTPGWMREQEQRLDDRMKEGVSHHLLLRLAVGVALAFFVTLLILNVLGIIPGSGQDHRQPSDYTQYDEEYPIEYYEGGSER